MRLKIVKQSKKFGFAKAGFLLAALAALILFPSAALAAPANWQANPAADDTVAWNAVTWSPQLEVFVAVGAGIMTSLDGINWTSQTAPAGTWQDVVWSPDLGLFVVVGQNGGDNALTSPDGINWTPRDVGSGSTFTTVTWSPEQNMFLAVSIPSAGTSTSPDGVNWTFHSSGIVPVLGLGVAWSANDNLYVVSSNVNTDPGRVYTSPDGINWTPQDTPNKQWRDVVYSPQYDLFVAVGTNGIVTSPDGITWTERTTPVLNLHAVTWSAENEEFVAVGTDGIVTSPDGVTWTPVTSPAANRWEGIVWSPELSRYVGVASTGTNRTMTGFVSTVPSVPLNLAADLHGESVNLTWNTPNFDGNSAITGYRIERSINGGPFEVLVANTNSTNTSYQDAGGIQGAMYMYRIYALNAQGQSLASNIATVTFPITLAKTGQNAIFLMTTALLLAAVGLISFFKSSKIRQW